MDLTNTEGETWVYNSSRQKVLATSGSIVKSETVTLTFARQNAGDLAAYKGMTFDVFVKGSLQLRVGTALGNTSGVVEADEDATNGIKVGQIKIGESDAILYNSVKDVNESEADAGLTFYYSISPKEDNQEITYDDETSYGVLSVVLTYNATTDADWPA